MILYKLMSVKCVCVSVCGYILTAWCLHFCIRLVCNSCAYLAGEINASEVYQITEHF